MMLHVNTATLGGLTSFICVLYNVVSEHHSEQNYPGGGGCKGSKPAQCLVYFDQILHAYAYPHWLTTCMCNILFLMDEGLLSISLVGCGQLVEMVITLEPRGIFGSNCKLNITSILSSCWENLKRINLPKITKYILN